MSCLSARVRITVSAHNYINLYTCNFDLLLEITSIDQTDNFFYSQYKLYEFVDYAKSVVRFGTSRHIKYELMNYVVV